MHRQRRRIDPRSLCAVELRPKAPQLIRGRNAIMPSGCVGKGRCHSVMLEQTFDTGQGAKGTGVRNSDEKPHGDQNDRDQGRHALGGGGACLCGG